MEVLGKLALIGGTGLSAYSTLEEGKEAAKEGKTLQQKYYAEAEATKQANLYEQSRMIEEQERRTASQIADISANGGLISGSNLQIIADSVYESTMDRIVTSRNYINRYVGLKQAGDIARYQGQLARRRARMRAFADVAGTAGMMYLNYKTPSSPDGGLKSNLEKRLGFKLTKAKGKIKTTGSGFKSKLREAVKKKK